jgi:hypothetical protein
MIYKLTKLNLLAVGIGLIFNVSANAAVSEDEFEALKKEVETLKVASNPRSVIHLAGYGNVNYSKVENGIGSFGGVSFSPIFHYQIDDHVMLGAELEIEDEDGETKTKLEYVTIDVVLNDYAVLVVGKFLSPIGQFRQNIHPSWINKLPSAPPGFGHGGAAPLSETGFQIRGGLSSDLNYAVYVGNGPEMDMHVENESGSTEEIEIHDVENEGFGQDLNGTKSMGGRIGWLGFGKAEIGASIMVGEADAEFTTIESAVETEQLVSADLSVFGLDFVVPVNDFIVRGEYLKQEVDGLIVESLDIEDVVWETMYVQGSYRFSGMPWELALRYTDFDAPEDDEDQEQIAFGVNYLLKENAQIKAAYESNSNDLKSDADLDSMTIQLSYGF